MTVKTYDPAQVALIFGGVEIGGYADGTFVTVARDEDAFSLQIGTNGEGVRSKSNNKSGTFTFTLLQSSASNAILSAIAQLDELTNAGVFPAMVKDNSGSSIHTAETAWIQKVPDSEYSKEAGPREWVIRTNNLQPFVGGN